VEFELEEATIAGLQEAMVRGELTAVAYLERIEGLEVDGLEPAR
jgi:hypothetical protein